MKRVIRYLAVTVIVLLVLLVALPFLIDVNQFRPVLQSKISTALGREVKVGKIALSLFSGSFSADDLSIADDPAFSKSPFLTAGSLKVGIELKPLIFSKAVRITQIRIEKPEVTLLRGRNGKWNFSSIGSGRNAAPEENSGGSGQGAAPDAVIKKFELVDGKLTVGAEGSRKRTSYEQLHIEAENVSLASQFHFKMSADLPQGGGLKLDGTAGPLDKADASMSPLEAKLSIDKLRLAETGFIDPASGIGGIMDFGGTLSSKQGQAHARGDVKLTNLQVVKAGSPAAVPVSVAFDSVYDLAKQSSLLKLGTVKAGAAVLNLTGNTRTVGDSSHIEMNLAGKDVPVKDLQALLPAAGITLPKGAALNRGTMNVKLNVMGPVERLVTSGDVGLFDAEMAGFDMGSKLAALSAFAGVKGEGGKTLIQKLVSSVRVSPDGIQAADLDLIVPSIGELRGSGTIAPNTEMNFKMSATLTSGGLVGGTLSRLTGTTRDTRIPFLIRGKTSDPKFQPDVGGMVKEVIPTDLGSTLKGLFSRPKKNP
jgi:AsmA protein